MGTTTVNLELYKPDVGEDDWGELVNANWDVIDALDLTGSGGMTDVTVLGTPNVAVTSHTTQNTTLYVSSARTATPTQVSFTNEFWKGMLLIVDVTAGLTTPSVTPKIQFQDPITATWLAYCSAGTPITSTGAAQYKYLIYPGISDTEMAGITENFPVPLPRTCRLEMTHADADSLTYSVAGIFLI